MSLLPRLFLALHHGFWIVSLALVFTASLAAGPASAQAVLSAQPHSIAKVLRARGQATILTVDEFDDPFIETSIDNIDYTILFYGCTEHQNCTSISLRAHRVSPGRASHEAMNAWSRDQRWTKLYTNDVNAAVLEMDLWFGAGSMEPELFGDYLNLWDRSLEQFVRYIDDGDYELIIN
ncbi:MAG: YbjN domain-containing protein [Pseudomonadota bacterium]